MSIPPPPAELDHLARLLGAAALFRLVEAHGGLRISIPRRMDAGHDLVTLLGEAPARKLAEAWGGEALKVPLARPWYARCLRAQGLSHAAIARRMRTTENTIGRLLAGPPDTRQMGLPL